MTDTLIEERLQRIEKQIADIRRARAGLQVQAGVNRLGQLTAIDGNLDMQMHQVKNMANATDNQDAVTNIIFTTHSHSGGIGAPVDHGGTLGLLDDDHTQYLNIARHDITARHPLGTVVPHDSHGSLTDLLLDHHTQYASANGSGTRPAYEASRLTKSVLAGNGLTGGGQMIADVTLDIGAGVGISVSADAVAIDLTASLTWTGSHVFQNTLTTYSIVPASTDTYDLGSTTKLWRKGYLSELDAVVFAINTVTLLGGWLFITKDEGTINADLTAVATTIDFGKAMTLNDFVLFRGLGQVEYVQVISLVSGTTYNVTRNLDGSGANAWPKGTPFAVLGQSGQGRIELNAYDTPRIQLITQGATYNAQAEAIRIGDLNGNWGYVAATWGMAIGEYAANKPNITIDPTNGLRIRNYSTDVLNFDVSGNAIISGKLLMNQVASAIAIGTTPPTSATVGTGIWIDRTGLYGLNANVQQAYINNLGQIKASAGDITIDASGLSINVTSDYDDKRSVLFKSGTTPILRLSGKLISGVAWGEMLSYPGGTSTYSNISIKATSGYLAQATARLGASVLDAALAEIGSAWVYTFASPTAASCEVVVGTEFGGKINLLGGSVAVEQHLIVGAAVPATRPSRSNIWLAETSAFTTPVAGYGAIYVKTDNHLYFKNDAGTEYRLNTENLHGIVPNPSFRSLSALPIGWAWAGTPFITPPTVNYLQSGMQCIGYTVASRSFVYKSYTANQRNHLAQASVYRLDVGGYVGFRIDDGTDNNYVELVQAPQSDGSFGFTRRTRTGGGAPVVTMLKSFVTPIPWAVLYCYLSGTLHSAWGVDFYIQGPGIPVQVLEFGGTALTWTPTRVGFAITVVTASATYLYATIDSYTE